LFAACLVLSLAGPPLFAQQQKSAPKAPFAAEGSQSNRPSQSGKTTEKRGWQAAPLTCNAQPVCTSSPSGRCVAVQRSYKDGTDRGRALEDTIRRCERANRQDSACGCLTQCRSVARCS
jgi:hypothetical protein